jgi:hypothetical protein
VQIYPSLEQNNKSVDKETGCEGVEWVIKFCERVDQPSKWDRWILRCYI